MASCLLKHKSATKMKTKNDRNESKNRVASSPETQTSWLPEHPHTSTCRPPSKAALQISSELVFQQTQNCTYEGPTLVEASLAKPLSKPQKAHQPIRRTQNCKPSRAVSWPNANQKKIRALKTPRIEVSIIRCEPRKQLEEPCFCM